MKREYVVPSRRNTAAKVAAYLIAMIFAASLAGYTCAVLSGSMPW